MVQAVIFDFDGVIIDSELLHLRALNQVLARHDFEISTDDYYKNCVGHIDIDLLHLFKNKGLLRLDGREIENLIEQKRDIFRELAEKEAKLCRGVLNFLQMLSQNTVPMAICSGSSIMEIQVILEKTNLHHFFNAIISSEHVKNGKPDPEGMLLALRKLRQKARSPIFASQCIVIEDSPRGVAAAKAAGMHAVAVTSSFDAHHLDLADKIVDHLGQLTISNLHQLCA